MPRGLCGALQPYLIPLAFPPWHREDHCGGRAALPEDFQMLNPRAAQAAGICSIHIGRSRYALALPTHATPNALNHLEKSKGVEK
jgi:hypothetical protein